MKFLIKTYGCQMNQRDSDMIAAMLISQGYEQADTEADADIVVVNTCSVRDKAEQKALGKLGLLTASRRERKGRIVGAVGCMVQRMGADILCRVDGLDFALGTHNLCNVPEAVATALAGNGPMLDISSSGKRSRTDLKARSIMGVSAFINILFGCDRRCSYCIVPEVRGAEWSRAAVDIIEEAESLVESGVREIVLLGQSVMSYGLRNDVWSVSRQSRIGLKEPFPRLLEALSEIPGLGRIRFTSAHPSGCTVEMARSLVELSPVCEHLHLPLQSGSNRILKLMRRGYSSEDFRRAIELLRGVVPGLAVTTDAIVGFPSESSSDFEATRSFMDEIMFDNAFVFKYSSRPGTPAAAWPDDVRAEEKLRRNHILLEDQDRRGLQVNELLVGRDLEVLVEGPSRRNASRCSGRTRTNKIVVFDASPHPAPGDLVLVSIDRAGEQTLYGKMSKLCRD